MTATPPGPNATSQPGKAAGPAGVALSALVALAVAALFLLQTGADRNTRSSSRPSHHTTAHPRDTRRKPTASRANSDENTAIERRHGQIDLTGDDLRPSETGPQTNRRRQTFAQTP
jgi:hypothetical protein